MLTRYAAQLGVDPFLTLGGCSIARGRGNVGRDSRCSNVAGWCRDIVSGRWGRARVGAYRVRPRAGEYRVWQGCWGGEYLVLQEAAVISHVMRGDRLEGGGGGNRLVGRGKKGFCERVIGNHLRRKEPHKKVVF